MGLKIDGAGVDKSLCILPEENRDQRVVCGFKYVTGESEVVMV